MTFSVIKRDLIGKILQRMEKKKNSLSVYFIEATGGTGKTMIARNLGIELGSLDGNASWLDDESGIAYSGILDLYDLDTNTNPGLEFRIKTAFFRPRDAFNDYLLQREFYESDFKLGVTGSQLEEQRKKVTESFAAGLKQVCTLYHPVVVFDTIERLDIATDPIQAKYHLTDDTAMVAGWICDQIVRLARGTVVLLGRPGLNAKSSLKDQLKKAIQKANLGEMGFRETKIEFFEPVIDNFNEEESQRFFADRAETYPEIKDKLCKIQKDIYQKYEGKPLFLDLAILSLAKSHMQGLKDSKYPKDPFERTWKNLLGDSDLRHIGESLMTVYWRTQANINQKIILDYLVAAKNGLSERLVRFLSRNDDLTKIQGQLEELKKLEGLPFIKSRLVTLERESGKMGEIGRVSQERIYFLHDEMYKLAETQVGEQQLRDLSREITQWYDLPENDHDGLRAASLLYRLRDNPAQGYSYFLQQSDAAIRGTKTSLEISLRDAIEIFISGAKMPKGEPGVTLRSDIDANILGLEAPHLEEQMNIDRVTLHIRRLMVRGKNMVARTIGDKELVELKKQYNKNPKEFGLSFSEFILWHGQVTMYGGDHKLAMIMYEKAWEIAQEYKTNGLVLKNEDKYAQKRLFLVLGRLLNNKGYTYWMFEGQYHRAIRELGLAVRFFNEADLREEKANTLDNIGRSYAALDNGQRAVSNIRWGLDIRQNLGFDFRVALSRISLAHALSVEERFQSAETEIKKALDFIMKGKIKRGIGLTKIARGLVLRKRAEWDIERGNKTEDVEAILRDAEESLTNAVSIFEEVNEPIRSVQAYNELGCVYRTRYFILTKEENSSRKSELHRAYLDASSFYANAINKAKEKGFLIEMLDSQQDRAVLNLRARKYDEAFEELRDIENAIPSNHHIKVAHGLEILSLEEEVNAFYKLMGLVELQRGTMLLLQCEQKNLLRGEEYNVIAKSAIERFAFAATYFQRFGGSHIADVYTFSRIQKRFRDINPDLVENILEDLLPRLIEEYRLDEKFLIERFESVFGSYA